MKSFLTTFIFIILAQYISAQAPNVISISPSAQYIAAAKDAAITVTFDTTLEPSSVNNTSFRVMGRWSGPASGTLNLQNDNTEVVFTPDEPFFAGENISVSLSKGIQSSSGENMAKGYAWTYWIATTPSEMVLEYVKTIELREPGETWLQTYGAYAGDLNNDGSSDLIVVNERTDDLRILLNDGQGDYGDYELIQMGNSLPSPNEGADFNNDGELDFAVSTAHGNEVRVFFGDGSGSLSNMESYTTGEGARGLVVLDCNGDGYDDMFITNRLSDNITMLTNNGDGTFETEMMNTTGQAETACAIGDANNDGIMDIFIGMYQSRELGIMIGDGEGNFTLGNTISVQGRPWMIAAGDLNGDGLPDVASANSQGNLSVVAFGDGQGGLSAPQTLPANNDRFPLAIDLGDLNGDGDLDIITSNYDGPNYTIFENDGTGQFTLATTLTAPNLASCAILHDRDNDGDLDVTLTDEGDDLILFYDNTSPTSIKESVDIPFHFEISPNPFSEQALIEVDFSKKTAVQVKIRDVQGKLVKQIASTASITGQQQWQWDARTDSGALVSNGVYFVLIEMDGQRFAKKLFYYR